MVYFLVAIVIIGLDLFSKKYVSENMKVEEKRDTKFSCIQIWHKKNYGISYNVLNKHPQFVTVLTIVASVVWGITFLMLLPIKGYQFLKLGFTFTLGGGMGNLLDRISNKCVTDFIYIKRKYAPIFNVADILVILGAIITLLASIKIKD